MYFLERGNSSCGFEHILLRHYLEKEGYIDINDIVLIEKVLTNGREMTSAELKDLDTVGFEGYRYQMDDVRNVER